MFSSCAGF